MNTKIIHTVLSTPTARELEISHLLVQWYEGNRRDLPWRHTSDPYLIWISEVILQQTRIVQGIDYYQRFIGRFPNAATLAVAPQEEVLKLWQGLGYYSRARHLHAAAHLIMERHGGTFPRSYAEVRSLPGIGDYTAAAIASIAWGEPRAAVDGNVFRVLSRLYAEATPIDTAAGRQLFTRLADGLLDPAHAGLHNQAMMELGALVCTPRQPDCAVCPLRAHCLANLKGDPEAYPTKKNRTKVRDRYFHYLFIICGECTWLHRRGAGDIWEGLYEFPLIETTEAEDFTTLQRSAAFRLLTDGAGKIEVDPQPRRLRHPLTHQLLHIACYTLRIEREPAGLTPYMKIPCAALAGYPVPAPVATLLEELSG